MNSTTVPSVEKEVQPTDQHALDVEAQDATTIQGDEQVDSGDEMPAQSKMEASPTKFTTTDIDSAKSVDDKIDTSKDHENYPIVSQLAEEMKSDQEKIRGTNNPQILVIITNISARDTKSAVDRLREAVGLEPFPVLDEVDALITSLTTKPNFDYEMNAAAEEKIKPRHTHEEGTFQFLPLTDESYNTQAKFQHRTASSETVRGPSLFSDDIPRRFRALTFSSPEAAAYHREVNAPYLKSPEQQQDYDDAVQAGMQPFGSRQGFPSFERDSRGRGKMVTRRSVSYVVDVPTLQEAVEEDPALILQLIKEMRAEIDDLKLELQKEDRVRKWTVSQYEVCFPLPHITLNQY